MKSKHQPQLAAETVLGAKLKLKRLAAGVTQWEVAEKLGYTTAQFISNWERGVSLPPMEVFPALAGLYSLSPSELFKMISEYQLQKLEEKRSKLADAFRQSR